MEISGAEDCNVLLCSLQCEGMPPCLFSREYSVPKRHDVDMCSRLGPSTMACKSVQTSVTDRSVQTAGNWVEAEAVDWWPVPLSKGPPHDGGIALFLNYFSSSPEQPGQRILAHKSEQPTADCIAIFHKYCCCIKHGGIMTNLNLWNPCGYVTDMPKSTMCVCGAWIRIYVLC